MTLVPTSVRDTKTPWWLKLHRFMCISSQGNGSYVLSCPSICIYAPESFLVMPGIAVITIIPELEVETGGFLGLLCQPDWPNWIISGHWEALPQTKQIKINRTLWHMSNKSRSCPLAFTCMWHICCTQTINKYLKLAPGRMFLWIYSKDSTAMLWQLRKESIPCLQYP